MIFEVLKEQKSTKNPRKIDPKIKPKNDEEKYRNNSNFGSQKPPKMRSTINQNPILKIPQKYVQQKRDGDTRALLEQVEVTHTTLKGGTALEFPPQS